MFCYRRHGHNEGDEPAFTQPLMYEKIKNRISIRELYTEQLVMAGELTSQEAETIAEMFAEKMRRCSRRSGAAAAEPQADHRGFAGAWTGLTPNFSFKPVETGVAYETLRTITEKAAQVPPGFSVNPKLARLLAGRVKTIEAKGAARLVVRRDAGDRLVALGRHPGSIERPGQPPRHLQPAARRAGRYEDRRALHSAQPLEGQPGRILRLRQPALRGGRAGVRLRLFAR